MIENWNIQEEVREEYLRIVRKAIVDSEAFNNFKRNSAVRIVVENTDYQSGLNCLGQIHLQDLIDISNLLEKEKIGNPITFDYYGINISPTTLRYIMHMDQIVDWFGILDDLKIGEIGAGYGGLCTVIHEYFKPKEYILFDLQEAKDFQKKYIKKFNEKIKITEHNNRKFDLLLAFCSWSELDKDTKLEYVETVFKKANKGVIAINYDFEENLQLIRDNLENKEIKVRIPGFIVTFE